MAQLDDYIAALDVTLTAEQYERLDRVSTPILGTPHEGADNILNSIFGGRLGQFDRLSVAS
jgi:hypothetical protein